MFSDSRKCGFGLKFSNYIEYAIVPPIRNYLPIKTFSNQIIFQSISLNHKHSDFNGSKTRIYVPFIRFAPTQYIKALFLHTLYQGAELLQQCVTRQWPQTKKRKQRPRGVSPSPLPPLPWAACTSAIQGGGTYPQVKIAPGIVVVRKGIEPRGNAEPMKSSSP